MNQSITVKVSLVDRDTNKSTLLNKYTYDLNTQEPIPEPEPPQPTVEKFEVLVSSLIVRDIPDLSGTDTGKRLTLGQVIDTTEFVIEDNYIWRKHSLGWSAEKHVTNTSLVFMKPYDPKVPAPQPGNKAPLFGRYQAIKYNGAWIMPKAAGLSFNVREMMYFGTSVMPNTSENDIYEVLDSFKREDCEIVRFYISHNKFDDINWQAARLKWFLDILRSKDFKAVPVFMDSLALSGYWIKSNEAWHNASSLSHLNIDWYKQQIYKGDTANRLRIISRVLKQYEDVVCTFDLCNEPAIVLAGFDSTNANAFKACWQYLSQIAYEETGKTIPITVGVIDSFGTHDHNLDIYKGALWFWDIPTLHTMSVHMYFDRYNQESKMFNTDIVQINADVAYALGMPVSIGEFGFESEIGGRRSEAFDIFLNRDVIGNGVFQALNWGGDLRYNSSDKGFTDTFAIADFRPDFYDLLLKIQEYQQVYFEPLEAI